MGKRRSWDRQTELRDCCSGAITGVLKHLGECSMGLHNALCCTVRQGLHYYPLKFKWRFQSSFRYKLPVTCVKLLANVKTFWFLFGYSQQFTNLSDFVFNLLTCCNFSKITSIRIISKRIRNIVQMSQTWCKVCFFGLLQSNILLFSFSLARLVTNGFSLLLGCKLPKMSVKLPAINGFNGWCESYIWF